MDKRADETCKLINKTEERKRMKPKDFEVFYDLMIKVEKEIFIDKGGEYSGEEDRFRNFKELGKELGIDPKKILWIYLRKHMDSIL